MKCTTGLNKESTITDCCEGSQIKHRNYTFRENKCYRDREYFGEIIERDDKIIKVKSYSSNKYLNGDIITFKIIK